MMPSSHNSNHKSSDLSFTILWSPLPPITWLIPFIGHTAIANSNGIASDFRGPYYVGDDGRMAFGAPTRAVKIDIGTLGYERWDAAIEEANDIYRERMHNICCDNCHSHVANALNRMPIKTPVPFCNKWNMVFICFYVFFRGKFLSPSAIFLQFGPFVTILLIWLLIKSL